MSCKSFPKFWLTGDKQKLNTSSDFVNQLYDYRPTELFYMPIYTDFKNTLVPLDIVSSQYSQ